MSIWLTISIAAYFTFGGFLAGCSFANGIAQGKHSARRAKRLIASIFIWPYILFVWDDKR